MQRTQLDQVTDKTANSPDKNVNIMIQQDVNKHFNFEHLL